MSNAVTIAGTAQGSLKGMPAARKAKDIPKVPRITALVREACELLADGRARNITEAAKLLKCSREHLSKQLSKEHVKAHMTRAAQAHIARHVYRAAHVKTALLDAESERVRGDTATEVLAMGGVSVPSNGKGVQVNVGVQVGYVVNWQPALDATPERS